MYLCLLSIIRTTDNSKQNLVPRISNYEMYFDKHIHLRIMKICTV